MASSKPKSKGKKPQQLLKPVMLVLAVVFLWSAQHEPVVFSIAGVAVWVLGAATMGLLTGAALALASPILKLTGAIFHHTVQELQKGAER